MTSRALTLSLIIFGLLMAALISRNGDLVLMTLPFLAYLAAAVLTSPSKEKTHLNAARLLNVVQTNGSSTIEVIATVNNLGIENLPVELSDFQQPGMHLIDGDLQQWTVLAPGEEARLKYTFQADRGGFHWKTLETTVGDSFGLFANQLLLPADAEMQVQPRPRKFRPIHLRPYSTLNAPGSIPARRAGSGTDFWGLREYHPGDPLNHLDWRLAARHPRQFFTREFEQENVADIGLILDARQSTNLVSGDDSLFEHTLSATASLAEMFLHQGHRVSLLVFEQKMIPVYPGYSKAQLNRILRCLANTRPTPTSTQYSLDFLPLNMFSSRALLIILSPLLASDGSIFPRLRAHGNQGLLICPDPFDFMQHDVAKDAATQLAVRVARVERRIELRKIAQLHIQVIDWQVKQPLSPLVRNALSHVRGAHARLSVHP